MLRTFTHMLGQSHSQAAMRIPDEFLQAGELLLVALNGGLDGLELPFHCV